MQIIKNEGNRELTYELVYDENVINKLIHDITNDCSLRIRRQSRIQEVASKYAIEKINSMTDYCGNKIYNNVSELKEEPVYDPCDYWRHGDPVPFSFYADTLVSPSLVIFLIKLLKNEAVDYDWFIERKELTLRESIQAEMMNLSHEIDQISNFDTDIKISKLQDLARKVEQFELVPNFDYVLLAKYYDLASQAISLELIQETIVYQRRHVSNK